VTTRMIPLDLSGKSLVELIRMALFNIDQVDVRPVAPPEDPDKSRRTPRELQAAWLLKRSDKVQALAKARPMDRLYRVKGGVVSATRGASPLAIITSYRDGDHGSAPEAGVIVLGVKRGLGSAEKPLAVTEDGLEDVTTSARAGQLPEQRSR
jgi:hypothetical protein